VSCAVVVLVAWGLGCAVGGGCLLWDQVWWDDGAMGRAGYERIRPFCAGQRCWVLTSSASCVQCCIAGPWGGVRRRGCCFPPAGWLAADCVHGLVNLSAGWSGEPGGRIPLHSIRLVAAGCGLVVQLRDSDARSCMVVVARVNLNLTQAPPTCAVMPCHVCCSPTRGRPSRLWPAIAAPAQRGEAAARSRRRQEGDRECAITLCADRRPGARTAPAALQDVHLDIACKLRAAGGRGAGGSCRQVFGGLPSG